MSEYKSNNINKRVFKFRVAYKTSWRKDRWEQKI